VMWNGVVTLKLCLNGVAERGGGRSWVASDEVQNGMTSTRG